MPGKQGRPDPPVRLVRGWNRSEPATAERRADARADQLRRPTVSNTAESSSASRVWRVAGTTRRSPGEPCHPMSPALAAPALQDVHGGLTWAVVLGQPVARGQCDYGLAQQVLVHRRRRSARCVPLTACTVPRLDAATGPAGSPISRPGDDHAMVARLLYLTLTRMMPGWRCSAAEEAR